MSTFGVNIRYIGIVERCKADGSANFRFNNLIRKGMLRLLQGSIPCCLIDITLRSHDAIVVWLFILS